MLFASSSNHPNYLHGFGPILYVTFQPGQICQLDYCFKILTTLIPSAILFLSDFTSSSFPQFQCFLAFFNAIFAVLVDVFLKQCLCFFIKLHISLNFLKIIQFNSSAFKRIEYTFQVYFFKKKFWSRTKTLNKNYSSSSDVAFIECEQKSQLKAWSASW